MNKTSTPKPLDESALAGLRHLEKSSQLLLATSPAISAYLGSQTNRLSSDLRVHTISKDRQKDKTCRGCGSTMIPGWSCKKSRKFVPKARTDAKMHMAAVSKPSSKPKPTQPDHIAYKCDRCNCISRFNLPEKKPLPVAGKIKTFDSAKAIKDKSNAPSSTTAAAPPPVQSVPSQPSSVKLATKTEGEVTGRKRAKKTKSGGLAALLAKSKSESASPAPFDLMDFMKTA